MGRALITSNTNWFFAKRAEQLVPRPPDSVAGQRLIQLAGETHLTQGPLAPDRFSDHMLNWQKRILKWLPFVDEVAIKMGKGSGKSFFCASIALAMAKLWIQEGTHRRALIAIVSANVESARIIYSHISEAVIFDKFIAHQWRTNVQQRMMIHEESGITVQILPPTLNRAIGLRPALLIIDELHEFAACAGCEDVMRQLELGGSNWEDFKKLIITTAPPGRGQPLYDDWLAKSRAIRDGELRNPRYLPALFEFPIAQRPELDPEDERYWFFGMPSLQRTKKSKGTMLASTMRRELKLALEDADVTGLGAYIALLSQRLGIEAEDRRGGGLTILAEYWDDALGQIPEGLPEGVYIGVDPSPGLEDPFAVNILRIFGDLMVSESRQWITTTGFERAPNRLKRNLEEAEAAGELTVMETDLEIEQDVHAVLRPYILDQQAVVGGDAAGLSGFKDRFERRLGTYVAVPQGWKLMAAFKTASGACHAGRLKHLGQPLMAANVKNLRVRGNNFFKADSRNDHNAGFDKIDGAMALFSAIYLMDSVQIFDVSTMIG